MSEQVFQSWLARLVTEPDLRESWRANPQGRVQALADLTPLERKRLAHIAAHPGLQTTALLHKGFRLGKLRGLLPLTFTLLSTRALHVAISQFWETHPPTSFYFLPEAIDFCDFLLWREAFSKSKYLREVVSFEKANLELQRARLGPVPEQRIRFEHNPSELLGTLVQGKRPQRIASGPCLAIGRFSKTHGKPHWEVVALDGTPLPVADSRSEAINRVT
ncbi:hypothetical protein [Hydrogenophaga sp. 5NK40-0174]|uniref:hypothetical protein n=1 Tax=Hydrogenophaga sp. 5NK40-0174 TaxID=3127649 RepID=UPI003105073F